MARVYSGLPPTKHLHVEREGVVRPRKRRLAVPRVIDGERADLVGVRRFALSPYAALFARSSPETAKGNRFREPARSFPRH